MRDHGKTFDIQGVAKAFGEAFDARGFTDAFRSALDFRNTRRSFTAGVRHGAEQLTRQARWAGAAVRARARRDDLVHGQLLLQRLLADMAGGGGAAAKALREIRDLMRPYNPRIDAIPDDHLPGLVKRIIEDLKQPAARAEDFPGAVGRALAEAQDRAAELDFAEAAQVLDAALAKTEAKDQERGRGRAALLAERGRIARLQLRYHEAAGFYQQAAGAVAFEVPLAWDYMLDAAYAYYAQGEEFGDNPALTEAIALYRSALTLVPREQVSLDWAVTQNDLGNALGVLGERENDTARLEDAVAAYRAALEEWTRERMPLRWATTQNNLGTALQSLGEREGGTARLEEAVTAYRAALEDSTRERIPLTWATTQNNLGTALQALGERQNDTARLEEAVAAFREALTQSTRERVPLDWAATQNNLGNALSRLGERESGTARLEEAVAAYRAALEESTRERVALAWATTQNNLGTALQALGERQSGTARLEEAAASYRAALEETTCERAPLEWAMIQNNLGTALEALGKRESGATQRARFEEAIGAFDAALAVFLESGAAWRAEICRANRQRAVELLEKKNAARS